MTILNHFIWAIDATEPNTQTNRQVGNFIQSLKRMKEKKISPCSILSLGDFGLHKVLRESEITDLKQVHLNGVKTILERSGFNQLNAEVIVTNERSIFEMIKALDKYIQRVGGDIVVMGTHQKQLLESFFLGSFTESYLLHGQCPGIFIPPGSKISKQGIRKAFLTTDLKQDYIKNFEKSLDYLNSFMIDQVELYHAVNYNPVYLYHPGFVEEKIKDKEESLEELREVAHKRDISLEWQVIDGEINLSKDIVNRALKTDSHLILVQGKSSPIKERFLGSTSRSVIRQSKVPVLVYY